MKKIFLLTQLLLIITVNNLLAQDYFEGQIDFKIEYESLNENISAKYLEYAIGDSFTAYIQEDRYIMIYNSKTEQGWSKSTIRLDEGYSYTEYEKSDTIYRSKLNSSSDILIEIKKHPNQKKMILGEMCPSITLKYESTDPNTPFKITDGTHYYSPKYKLNSEKYKNFTSGFWNLFVNESESVSIRNEHIYTGFFKSISEATKIQEKKISDDLFTLNSDKILIDSE
ncbi:hypothetical protein [Ulvibacter litoralis]|uniref:GLPGLI family protein n=1 Tax=Ulvibacter litoralis TaxID=227084 RepID=A0A1G7H3N5_9FLAO|nr:hypothetical protein [Ulvibacter litoralis]GHC59018.1 hypothetical protein GCM10008083_24690 [Ulvibacter litoralis]SDE94913.1 hypothetical protein SAMN05421855_103503 [Ulvibacter litoralis]